MRSLSLAVPMVVLFGCTMLVPCRGAEGAQGVVGGDGPGQSPTPCKKPVTEITLSGRALVDYRQLKAQLKIELPDLRLRRAEERLLRATVMGTIASAGNCAIEGDATNDPAEAAQWGPERTVNSKLLRWLVIDPQVAARVGPKGIQLLGARIDGGDLDLSYAVVRLPLNLAHCSLGNVKLSHSETHSMDFDGSSVESFDGLRLSAKGDLLINDEFHASGLVDLTGAEIDGDLKCNRGRFDHQPEALVAARAQIRRSAYFEKLRTCGLIRLNRATIKEDLDFDWAQFLRCPRAQDFQNPEGAGLQAALVTVKGALFWQNVILSPKTSIDLSFTTIGTLWDGTGDWPDSPNLNLDGFVYKEIQASSTAKDRLVWLQRQSLDFKPQPYLQLANVLKQRGLEGDAIEVLVANEQRGYEAASKRSSSLVKYAGHAVLLWSFLLKYTIGYGYRPFLALLPIIFFVLLGSVLFSLGYYSGVLTPTDKEAYKYFTQTYRTSVGSQKAAAPLIPPAGYQPFNFLFYSLETFLPLVKLHQEDNWLPNGELEPKWRGALLRYYLWIHILAGWFFTAMLVAGVGGLVHGR